MVPDSHMPEVVGRAMEILLVEDSLMDAKATIAALQDGGIKHRLTLMRDGMETMEFLHRRDKFRNAPRPDLVLLDLVLPKKDGLEVLAEIREDEQFARLPVVVLTASDAQADQDKCEFLRVDAFLSKPVLVSQFLDVIRQLKRYWIHDLVLPS
ncbi:MAG: response regulator [Planctomycetales bacterium]|nr:response regulator [Planctomycetales bacterium]